MHLNLARKWRSKVFDELIGQDLAVRLVRNSLYRNQFFPVYLLSGQRGCGKTTMGRVFATAINCARLEEFQKQPRDVSIPCLVCPSCCAMAQGSHPDFIEIDAASHTGVDNVRAIIEAASYLPVLGRKKIYLIDEAHMLSKAAFNALLKILEEPPMTALFMLATTDPHKIIDTIKSRCFQLFFDPVKPAVLMEHLQKVCREEAIIYDEPGLLLVAHETEGSVRDALNLIERVRLAHGSVTKEAVVAVVGSVSNEKIISLVELMLHGSSIKELLQQLNALQGSSLSAQLVWKKIVAVVRAAIFAYHGLSDELFAAQQEQLSGIAQASSYNKLIHVLEVCYEHESLLAKTTAPHSLLELMILKIVAIKDSDFSPVEKKTRSEPIAAPPLQLAAKKPLPAVVLQEKKISEDEERWLKAVKEVADIQDPLLLSVFKQARFLGIKAQRLEVSFSKKFIFFSDVLDGGKAKWQPILDACWAFSVELVPLYVDEDKIISSEMQPRPVSSSENKVAQPTSPVKASSFKSQEYKQFNGIKPTRRSTVQPLDISDHTKWQKAHMVVRHFPGVITEDTKDSA